MFSFFKSSYQKIKRALTTSGFRLGKELKRLFAKPIDENTLRTFEKLLYEADVGSLCTQELVQEVKRHLQENPHASFASVITTLRSYSLKMLQSAGSFTLREATPSVFLIVGINGSGKTTSIAKLAHLFQREGKKVLLVAADTFRAAAGEQISTWAKRLGIEIVSSQLGADPSAVVYDGLSAAKARASEIVLVDTAGRLQSKTDLMQELQKVKRVCDKVIPSSPHETLLVLDATTGQNGLDQARLFHASTPLTGIILTKLDGSAKGGIVLAIYRELGIPVRWIGVGEQAEDLLPFVAEDYLQALFDTDDTG